MNSPRDVFDVAKAPCLVPGAEDREGLHRERLANKRRNNHSVAAGLPRPHSVKEAHDSGRQLSLFLIRKRQELVDQLARSVAPTTLHGRAKDKILILAEGHLLALSVDLRRARDEHALALLRRCTKNDLRPMHVQ